MSDVVLKWYGDRDIARNAGRKALGWCAADLQGKSVEQAPVLTGDLRANCSTTPIKETGDKMETMIGYDLPYAKRQHEHLEYRHPRGGKAKFLEDPFNANKDKYERYISNEVKRALRKGR